MGVKSGAGCTYVAGGCVKRKGRRVRGVIRQDGISVRDATARQSGVRSLAVADGAKLHAWAALRHGSAERGALPRERRSTARTRADTIQLRRPIPSPIVYARRR